MNNATKADKQRVVDILSRSFDTNLSVNYIARQGNCRQQHIRALMAYSFDLCMLYGEVFLSDDKNACALIIYPDKKKASPLADIKLIFNCIGIGNIRKALAREALLNETREKGLMTNLWFIGVDTKLKGKGAGSRMLEHVIAHSNSIARPIYLETSNTRNLPWYQKFGFEIYAERDIGHTLYFLRRQFEPGFIDERIAGIKNVSSGTTTKDNKNV